MSAVHSTGATRASKPAKPRPDFPLFPHATGRWAKKIRGRLVYFGPWEDPDGALDKYLSQRDDLHAGRKPRGDAAGLTVKDLVNLFLDAKEQAVAAGELRKTSWAEYEQACELVTKHFGKGRVVTDIRPEDFAPLRKKMAKRWGPVTLGNVIQRVRCLFKYASDNELIDRPVRYGSAFERPTKKTLRLHRAAQGPRLFTAAEIHRLLAAAGPQLRAMILLGINCGFGNADCGNLPRSAIDLDGGWVDFPRPKTGIPRRCALWPETMAAIRAAADSRPTPKNAAHAGLAFITKYGTKWAKDARDNPLSKEMAKLLRELGINGRPGLGFYTLRHTFRTVADATKDQPAVDFIMGHTRDDMASVYREGIDDARLQAVAEHVRTWLYGARP